MSLICKKNQDTLYQRLSLNLGPMSNTWRKTGLTILFFFTFSDIYICNNIVCIYVNMLLTTIGNMIKQICFVSLQCNNSCVLLSMLVPQSRWLSWQHNKVPATEEVHQLWKLLQSDVQHYIRKRRGKMDEQDDLRCTQTQTRDP